MLCVCLCVCLHAKLDIGQTSVHAWLCVCVFCVCDFECWKGALIFIHITRENNDCTHTHMEGMCVFVFSVNLCLLFVPLVVFMCTQNAMSAHFWLFVCVCASDHVTLSNICTSVYGMSDNLCCFAVHLQCNKCVLVQRRKFHTLSASFRYPLSIYLLFSCLNIFGLLE